MKGSCRVRNDLMEVTINLSLDIARLFLVSLINSRLLFLASSNLCLVVLAEASSLLSLCSSSRLDLADAEIDGEMMGFNLCL